MSRRIRTLTRVASALAVLALAGCAVLPSGGGAQPAPVQPSQQDQRDQQGQQVRMTSRVPAKGMNAEQVVANFLQASTGYDLDPAFSIAKLYLTPEFQQVWTGNDGALIWDGVTPNKDNKPLPLPSPPVAADPGNPDDSVRYFKLDGNVVGTLDAHGFYSPNPDVNVDRRIIVGKQKDGSWRIESAPLQRVISQADFQRAIPAPFIVHRPSTLPEPSDTVADQVYLTQSPDIRNTYQALVQAALSGRTDIDYGPQGVATSLKVTSVGIGTNGGVTVHLDRAPGSSAVVAVEHAIARTLGSVNSSPFSTLPVPPSLQIEFGKGAALQTFPTETGPDHPSLPYVYLVTDKGKLEQLSYATPTAQTQTPSTTPSATTPTPLQGFDNVDLAAAKSFVGSPGGTKGAKGPGGSTGGRVVTIAAYLSTGRIAVGDQDSTSAPQQIPTPHSKVTSLAWDPIDGSLWFADNGGVYRLTVGADGKLSNPAPVMVDDPSTGGSGQNIGNVRQIRFSPDGLRAVLVTGDPTGGQPSTEPTSAWMASVVRNTSTGAAVSLTPQFKLQPSKDASQPRVYDAAWTGLRTVVLLESSAIYLCYADGSQDAQLLAATATAPAFATQLAAEGMDVGRTPMRIFTNGQAQPGGVPTIFWKAQPNVQVAAGDHPFLATPVLYGDSVR